MNLLVQASGTLCERHPEADVRISEFHGGEAQRPLPRGGVDVMDAGRPVDGPGVGVGPVLSSEQRVPAVATRHPLAVGGSARPEDLTDVRLLDTPALPARWVLDRAPRTTPSRRPIERGPQVRSVTEALALIAEGAGAFPFSHQVNLFNRHPVIAYLPVVDAPADRGLVWPTGGESPLLHAFVEAVHERTAKISGPARPAARRERP
ncbi:substrate-binding domain-containing protein [Streptomyces sp. NBC_01235]|uniref:substrate-binding domain-containing protein n=1 Tax=Streptomyces sp. NBC_01235 TaxID=2903788 RepID=UPI003FA35599